MTQIGLYGFDIVSRLQRGHGKTVSQIMEEQHILSIRSSPWQYDIFSPRSHIFENVLIGLTQQKENLVDNWQL